MTPLSNAATSYDYVPDQDSFIAINVEGIVVSHCYADGEVTVWMESYPEHNFLITSTSLALSMIGKSLPEGDVDVLVL